MTSPLLPASVASDGTTRVDYVLTLANPAVPILAELNAVTSLALSPYLTGDGFQPGGDQATITDQRLATTQDFERRGRKTKTCSVVYVHNPDDADDNEAYLTLAEDTLGFLVVRYGVPYTQAWAASDIVDTWPIECGEPFKQINGANSVHTISQKLFVTNVVLRDVLVAAS